MPATENKNPLIELTNISKSFPGVKALDDINFRCFAGEVHAIVGENGAGKSTLIKIMSGVYHADQGQMLMHGKTLSLANPVDAHKAGIAVIHQEFSLLPERTVSQNIFLGREPKKGFFIDQQKMHDETQQLLQSLAPDSHLQPDDLVSDLDVATQQLIEIIKALSLNASVLIMDEPTAALNNTEAEKLFTIIEKLKSRGTAIIYISHRMEEINRLADRITVIRDGQVSRVFDSLPSSSAIVEAMVGREIDTFYPPRAAGTDKNRVVLKVSHAGNQHLSDINFRLHEGEILGIAGIQGAGRVALARALFGDIPFTSGEITLGERKVRIANPRDAINHGIGLLPGDRKAEGLTLMQSVRDNAMLSSRAFSSLLKSHHKNQFTATDKMNDLLQQLQVKAASFDVEIQSLSGGNQQKAIVARWLEINPGVLIFIEPTRGIDVNTKAGIYRLMRDLTKQKDKPGNAILMISSDLPEVIGVADRILVMRNGRIVKELPGGCSETEIMHYATSENVENEAENKPHEGAAA